MVNQLLSASPPCTDGCHSCDHCCTCEGIPDPRRLGRLRGLAWLLTAATIGWNVAEALVAIVSGAIARSASLLGFGLDSVIEVTSALVVAWRLSRQSADPEANERAERRAVRLIAISFFGIAAYVGAASISQLLGREAEPDRSPAGLLVVAASLVVMPVLAWSKRRVAISLSSA